MSAKCNGTKYALESFCFQHRAKYQQIVEAAAHITFQVPTDHTRVGYSIENIEYSDAVPEVSIAKVWTDNGGARQDFEQVVTEILPVDPLLASKPSPTRLPLLFLEWKVSREREIRLALTFAGIHQTNGRDSLKISGKNYWRGGVPRKVKLLLKKRLINILRTRRRDLINHKMVAARKK